MDFSYLFLYKWISIGLLNYFSHSMNSTEHLLVFWHKKTVHPRPIAKINTSYLKGD